MEKDYSKLLIKEYKYWLINVHENQGYLGRSVIWCKRENALDLTDATKEEQEELFVILKDLKNAIQIAFNPDWCNYAFLGNGAQHLHAQFIPRYTKPKQFMGITFEDHLYGHNYKTNHDFVTSEDVLREVVRLLKTNLG